MTEVPRPGPEKDEVTQKREAIDRQLQALNTMIIMGYPQGITRELFPDIKQDYLDEAKLGARGSEISRTARLIDTLIKNDRVRTNVHDKLEEKEQEWERDVNKTLGNPNEVIVFGEQAPEPQQPPKRTPPPGGDGSRTGQYL